MKILLSLLACVFLWALPASAQSTAAQDTPGYLTLTPQTNCPTAPCFVQYGAAVPVASLPYPATATPVTISATGTTAAYTATLAAVAGMTTYICGFNSTSNATALAQGTLTLTGVITGTMSFAQTTTANTTANAPLAQTFSPCVPASAANTAIVVNVPAPGSGGVSATSAWGYQL